MKNLFGSIYKAMRISIFVMLLAIMHLCACSRSAKSERIDGAVLSALVEGDKYFEMSSDAGNLSFPNWTLVKIDKRLHNVCLKDMQIGGSLKMRATVYLDPSLNGGSLEIANVNIKILHCRYDDNSYKDGFLDVDFIDIDGDGFKDIAASGLLYCALGEGRLPLYCVPVSFVYLFDPAETAFYRSYRNAYFDSADGPSGKITPDPEGKFIADGIKASWNENNTGADGKFRECVRISPEDFPAGKSASSAARKTVPLGHGKNLDISLDKERHRASIANLSIIIGNELYDGWWLTADLVDLNHDGWKDLVVSGLVYYPNDADGATLLSESALFIYMYNPAANGFRLAYRDASFKLEDGPREGRRLSNVIEIDTAIRKGREAARLENESCR